MKKNIAIVIFTILNIQAIKLHSLEQLDNSLKNLKTKLKSLVVSLNKLQPKQAVLEGDSLTSRGGVISGRNQNFDTVPNLIKDKSGTSINTVYLSGNNIKEIDFDKLAQHKEIRLLEADSNKLTSIGEGVSKLAKLETLKLDSNRIKTIHKDIGSLSKLKSLHLVNNQLESLPDSIGQLSSLLLLDLNNNSGLSQLPNSIENLTGVKIYLNGTKVTDASMNAIGFIKVTNSGPAHYVKDPNLKKEGRGVSVLIISSLQKGLEWLKNNQYLDADKTTDYLKSGYYDFKNKNMADDQVVKLIPVLAQIDKLLKIDAIISKFKDKIDIKSLKDFKNKLSKDKFKRWLSSDLPDYETAFDKVKQDNPGKQDYQLKSPTIGKMYKDIIDLLKNDKVNANSLISTIRSVGIKDLDFSGNNLTKIPDKLASFSSITRIDFQNNSKLDKKAANREFKDKIKELTNKFVNPPTIWTGKQ